MNIVAPVWFLDRECPSCEQGDSLTYLYCRACGKFLFICDEERITFDDLSLADLSSGTGFKGECTYCDAKDSLRPATGEEFQELGFRPGQFH